MSCNSCYSESVTQFGLALIAWLVLLEHNYTLPPSEHKHILDGNFNRANSRVLEVKNPIHFVHREIDFLKITSTSWAPMLLLLKLVSEISVSLDISKKNKCTHSGVVLMHYAFFSFSGHKKGHLKKYNLLAPIHIVAVNGDQHQAFKWRCKSITKWLCNTCRISLMFWGCKIGFAKKQTEI